MAGKGGAGARGTWQGHIAARVYKNSKTFTDLPWQVLAGGSLEIAWETRADLMDPQKRRCYTPLPMVMIQRLTEKETFAPAWRLTGTGKRCCMRSNSHDKHHCRWEGV